MATLIVNHGLHFGGSYYKKHGCLCPLSAAKVIPTVHWNGITVLLWSAISRLNCVFKHNSVCVQSRAVQWVSLSRANFAGPQFWNALLLLRERSMLPARVHVKLSRRIFFDYSLYFSALARHAGKVSLLSICSLFREHSLFQTSLLLVPFAFF